MHQSFLSRALLFALPVFMGCRDAARSSTAAPPPPAAEFVLAAGDSAFWVTSDSAGIRSKGVPIELARYGGRFFELYVVDDDLSFQGAELVGQSVYRRDLRTGDSVIVFTDSLVPKLAREYADRHPDDHPLDEDEDVDPDPELRATATLDLGTAHGPFVSYSLHTDVERVHEAPWHSSRRGVLDLRTGRTATVADVAGPQAADVERSARGAGKPPHHPFDPRSFAITTIDGAPAIAYALPGAGEDDDGLVLPLAPIRITDPIWWRDVAASLPTTFAEGSREVWRHNGYAVVVRYDSIGDASLTLRDSTSREWPIGHVTGPATRIFWLDRPALDGDTRHALSRAFIEAAGYGGERRVAITGGKRKIILASRAFSSH